MLYLYKKELLIYLQVLEFHKKFVLVGYSGHAISVCDIIQENNFNILGYCDKIKKKYNPYGIKFLGNERELNFKLHLNNVFFISIGNNQLRVDLSNFIRESNGIISNVISKSSYLSKEINLGSGIFISKNVTINAFSNIEDDVIINTSASIDHECYIKKGSHIAPGAVLLGNVEVGYNSLIGANSVVKEGIKIGNNVIIGAGSVVLDNVKDNSLMYGNPARLR